MCEVSKISYHFAKNPEYNSVAITNFIVPANEVWSKWKQLYIITTAMHISYCELQLFSSCRLGRVVSRSWDFWRILASSNTFDSSKRDLFNITVRNTRSASSWSAFKILAERIAFFQWHCHVRCTAYGYVDDRRDQEPAIACHQLSFDGTATNATAYKSFLCLKVTCIAFVFLR